MRRKLTVAQLNRRLAALRLLPLDEEQTHVFSDPREREQRKAMLEDLRDRCALPLTDSELESLCR
jgi:hypothetical protein